MSDARILERVCLSSLLGFSSLRAGRGDHGSVGGTNLLYCYACEYQASMLIKKRVDGACTPHHDEATAQRLVLAQDV